MIRFAAPYRDTNRATVADADVEHCEHCKHADLSMGWCELSVAWERGNHVAYRNIPWWLNDYKPPPKWCPLKVGT